jgi:hypothetical protein
MVCPATRVAFERSPCPRRGVRDMYRISTIGGVVGFRMHLRR